MEELRRHFQSVEQIQATQYRAEAKSMDLSQPPRPENESYCFLVLDPLHCKVTYLCASVFLIYKMETRLSTAQGDAGDEMSLTCHTHSVAISLTFKYSKLTTIHSEESHSSVLANYCHAELRSRRSMLPLSKCNR